MYISWLAILCMNLIGFTLILNVSAKMRLKQLLRRYDATKRRP